MLEMNSVRRMERDHEGSGNCDQRGINFMQLPRSPSLASRMGTDAAAYQRSIPPWAPSTTLRNPKRRIAADGFVAVAAALLSMRAYLRRPPMQSEVILQQDGYTTHYPALPRANPLVHVRPLPHACIRIRIRIASPIHEGCTRGPIRTDRPSVGMSRVIHRATEIRIHAGVLIGADHIELQNGRVRLP